MKTNVLGIKFDNITMKKATNRALSYVANNKKATIYTPNPEMVMLARKDKEFANILNGSDMLVPDGVGVVWASRYSKNPLKERVAGFDLVMSIFEGITNETVFFLGGAPNVAAKAKQRMEKRFPNIQVIGTNDGYFKDDNQIIEMINKKSPDILLVGLGMGRQEKWINKYKNKLNAKLFIGVGGSFDVMSGNLKRAPKIWQKMGLEWLFRLICQPKRIWRQRVLLKYVLTVLKGSLFQQGRVEK